METGRIQNIRDAGDASVGLERKRVNSVYDRGSELNIPLSNGGDRFGALILLSAATHAFSDDDVRIAARIARCVELITLGFEKHLIILRPLSSQQLVVKQAIHADVERLYTSRSFTSMPDIRDTVLQYIAGKAKEHTGADVAAVVLAEEASNSEEQASDGEEELVWSMRHCASEIGAPSNDKPFRLKKTEGLIGIAYTTGKPLRERNVRNPDNPALKDMYVEAFQQVNSEMVIPLKGRRRTWGVIDVESVQPDHFTHGHQEWVEFLAAEAVNLLEALELATRRWYQERLVTIDTALAMMRESKDLVEIQKRRQDLLQTLLQDTRDLTGASTAQIYVVVNMYQDLEAHDDGEPVQSGDADPHEGVLGAVIVSPTRDMDEEGFHRNIRINQGMAGKVVATKRRLFFKDKADRPPEYIPNPRYAESALVVPILEGHRVIAVLNLESDAPRWCGNLQIEIAEYAASLIANILVAYRLSVEMLQAEMLLTFNVHWESPNVSDFIGYVLRFADELTASLDPIRWGQLALVEDGAISYAVTGQFPDRFSDSEENQSTQRLPEVYSVFQRVLQDKHPALIPNLEEPTIPADRDSCPWTEAKSLLCVPLRYQYADSTEQSVGETVIGLLTIASSQSYMLNDSDRTALSKLAPLIVHGLEDIATLYSRVSLMEVLKREFAILGDPDPKPIASLRVKIQRIPRTSDAYESALEAAKQFDDIVSPFLLLAQLPQWYLLLSSYNSFAPSEANTESGELLTLGAVIESLRPLIHKFVEKQLSSGVTWDFVSPSAAYDASNVKLKIGSNDPDKLQLLKAAIFGCVSAAVTASFEGRGLRNDICIRITTTAQETASIVVEYVGQPISDNQRLKPFPRHILSEQLQLHTVEIPELQLFEVGRIARFLDGELTIGRPSPDAIQTITLTIPSTL
jgi:putative methionine-R-sulfoxide reductase with GAF domain